MKKSLTKDYNNDIKIPKNIKKIKYEDSINDSLFSSKGKSSMMNKSSERKINLNESTKIEHQINLNNLKIGLDNDDLDENIIQINNNINNNNKEDDKETDDYIMEIKNRPSLRQDKNNKDNKDINLDDSSNISSDSKKEKQKIKGKKLRLNRSSEINLEIFEEKEGTNKNKILEIKKLKIFF